MEFIEKGMLAKADALFAGERITLPPFSVKTKKRIRFSCRLSSLGEGKILVGHGKEVIAGSWLEITKTAITAFAYYSYMEEPLKPLFAAPIEHHLCVEGSLCAEIEIDPAQGVYSVLLETPTGRFTASVNGWDGCNGEIFASAEDVCLSDCTLTFESESLLAEVVYLGDSYISLGSEKRWPYYFFRDGYKDLMLLGYPGMRAEVAAEQLPILEKLTRARIAVWALGMNNSDKDGAISPEYLKATQAFLAMCEEKGITPVLSTIPSNPVVDNRYKNAWVRSLPHRYADFSTAVGAEEDIQWYEGMQAEDGAHPTEKGAQALYYQLLKDVPEVKK